MDIFDEKKAKRVREITYILENLDHFNCEAAEDRIASLEAELIELYHCKREI